MFVPAVSIAALVEVETICKIFVNAQPTVPATFCNTCSVDPIPKLDKTEPLLEITPELSDVAPVPPPAMLKVPYAGNAPAPAEIKGCPEVPAFAVVCKGFIDVVPPQRRVKAVGAALKPVPPEVTLAGDVCIMLAINKKQ